MDADEELEGLLESGLVPDAAVDALESAWGEAAQLKEELSRLIADNDNYRKRLVRDQVQASQAATGRMVASLLPVWDDLELCLVHADDTADVATLREGVELTLRRLQDALAGFDVRPFDVAVGAPFDPSQHEAVAQVVRPQLPDNSVVNLVQTGFRQGERLLRPARVTVADNRNRSGA